VCSSDLVNMSATKWSVAISKDDLVKVQSLQDVEYNVPLVSKNTLSDLLILDWAGTGEEKTAEISPGVYDWLIVMDHNGDGRVDSYHGTLATDIKLRRYEFLGGHHYKIKVNEDESVEVKMD